jgi:hypothetical protein
MGTRRLETVKPPVQPVVDNAIVRWDGTDRKIVQGSDYLTSDDNGGLANTGSGNWLQTGTGAIGYGTGAGGAATQDTSTTTGVTLSKNCGTITTFAQDAAAGVEVDFVVTNTEVAAGDVVAVCIKTHTSAGSFIASVVAVAAGSFTIRLTNLHGSTAGNGVLVINFVVIKAVAA